MIFLYLVSWVFYWCFRVLTMTRRQRRQSGGEGCRSTPSSGPPSVTPASRLLPHHPGRITRMLSQPPTQVVEMLPSPVQLSLNVSVLAAESKYSIPLCRVKQVYTPKNTPGLTLFFYRVSRRRGFCVVSSNTYPSPWLPQCITICLSQCTAALQCDVYTLCSHHTCTCGQIVCLHIKWPT